MLQVLIRASQTYDGLCFGVSFKLVGWFGIDTRKTFIMGDMIIQLPESKNRFYFLLPNAVTGFTECFAFESTSPAAIYAEGQMKKRK